MAMYSVIGEKERGGLKVSVDGVLFGVFYKSFTACVIDAFECGFFYPAVVAWW